MLLESSLLKNSLKGPAHLSKTYRSFQNPFREVSRQFSLSQGGGQALILKVFLCCQSTTRKIIGIGNTVYFSKFCASEISPFLRFVLLLFLSVMSRRLQSKLLRIINTCNLFSYTPVARRVRLRFWSGF